MTVASQEEAALEASPDTLAVKLLESGALSSDWLPAYKANPREGFVPDDIWPGNAGGNRQGARVRRSNDPMTWYRVVYSDVPITTQWDDGRYAGPDKGRAPTSSISMPTMVFTMLDALDLQHGHKVLEIGTGRGWNTALLSYRVGDKNVTSIEKDDVLAEDARVRLNCSGFSPDLVVGDGERGHGTNSPYDRIIATCSVGAIPSQWIGQAQPGAVIVAPWGPQYGGEALVRLEIDERGTASGNFVGSSAFMRMSGHRKSLTAPHKRLNRAEWPGGARLTSSSLSPDDVGDWIHMFAIGIQVPDLYCKVEFTAKDSYRLWLADTSTGSWASADYASGLIEYAVAQDGHRRLWDELEAAWRWWDNQGRPGFNRFGMTTTGAENYTIWLDSPDNPVPTQVGAEQDARR
ncbi:rRNA adenine N-6-methyltransferase family protein [Streptomyces sp. NPDC058257]|uniref:rRNA adenine N-6-methyltransferase family protein n=1 Tax=Streptomyces sp. NPDC058257 TaxID=3346409 RepID=UPI0036E6AD50